MLSCFDSFKISFLVNDVGLFYCVMHGNNVNPANIYLFKSTIKALEEGVKNVQS